MKSLISILGPTASGKSAVAMELARRLTGEIVSCDSMQVYKGMTIGTAAPSQAERREVPHHLVATLDIQQPYDVHSFRQQADAAIRDILARDRQPILCGGTGYYAKLLLYGLPLPPGDPEVARNVRQTFDDHGPEVLRQELAAIDPATLARVEDNPHRLMRAVEIVRVTGAPVPPQEEPQPPPYLGPQFILMPDADLSRERIARRTRQMIDHGWLDETAELVARGLCATPTAAKALGYPQVAEWLAGPRTDLPGLEERITILTRQYARRQRTWFRHQHPGATILPVTEHDTPVSLADQLIDALGNP